MGRFLGIMTSGLIAIITSSFGYGWFNDEGWNPPGIFINLLLVVWINVFIQWIENLMKKG